MEESKSISEGEKQTSDAIDFAEHITLEEGVNYSLQALSDFIFTSKYARYLSSQNRRETWTEAVDRVLTMHLKRFKHIPTERKEELIKAFDLVHNKVVAPSMRSLQFGGDAMLAQESKGFNCAVRHIDSLRSFAEVFHLLLNGCGVGIGLSEKFLARLPDLVNSEDKTGSVVTYTIEDTIEGWANSVEALLQCYFRNTPYTGKKLTFDYSKIRRKGSILKTTGGKAPGHLGLRQAHEKIKALLDYLIEDLHLTRLRSLDACDVNMFMSDAVLSGGVRRAAMAVTFQKGDELMLNAKIDFKVDKVFSFDFSHEETKGGYTTRYNNGRVLYKGKKVEVCINDWELEKLKDTGMLSWFHLEPQRARSNNSVLLLRGTVTLEEFTYVVERTREYGEPGFVWANHCDTLLNPCYEIGFIPVAEGGECGVQFCNLTTMNGSKLTTYEKFREAALASVILGTFQASYTHFPFLSPVAKKLTEEEALLGCSITGMFDNPDILLNPEYQRAIVAEMVELNKVWAEVLGIKPAARITAIKPEGTASIVFQTASGIHPHHARRYFRRVQMNKTDNVYAYFKNINLHACEESVWSAAKTDDIAMFPIEVKSPNAMFKADLTAIQHLEIIKSTQMNWVVPGTTEANTKDVTHNVSCTVIVDKHEWADVTEYIFENQNTFAAVSLLPKSGDKDYQQAPMEAITTEQDEAIWKELVENFKQVDYTKMVETTDHTALQLEASCAGGNCERV